MKNIEPSKLDNFSSKFLKAQKPISKNSCINIHKLIDIVLLLTKVRYHKKLNRNAGK